MKTLLCKLRHSVTDAPGIPIAEVRGNYKNIKDMTEITNKIYYVGVNDRNKHRFEGCHENVAATQAVPRQIKPGKV